MMIKVSILVLTGVLVGATLCLSAIEAVPRNYNEVKTQGSLPEYSEKPFKPIRDVNCFDSNNIPYIERIPDPYNCSLFYKCDRIFPEEPMHPFPIRQECPPGLGLCYDYISCNCEYCDVANCFDPENPEHVEDRFNCACPLLGESDGADIGKDPCTGSKHL